MSFASGLGCEFAELASLSARKKLVAKVIKSLDILNMRDQIDSYPKRYPSEMTQLDKTLCLVFLQSDKVHGLQ